MVSRSNADGSSGQRNDGNESSSCTPDLLRDIAPAASRSPLGASADASGRGTAASTDVTLSGCNPQPTAERDNRLNSGSSSSADNQQLFNTSSCVHRSKSAEGQSSRNSTGDVRQSGKHQHDRSTTKKRRKLGTALMKVGCCLGWMFLCPCWSFGVCVREHPESFDDLREDPCWPCFYRPQDSCVQSV